MCKLCGGSFQFEHVNGRQREYFFVWEPGGWKIGPGDRSYTSTVKRASPSWPAATSPATPRHRSLLSPLACSAHFDHGLDHAEESTHRSSGRIDELAGMICTEPDECRS